MIPEQRQIAALRDPEPIPEFFAVPESVWALVRKWCLARRESPGRIDGVCMHCGQGVLPIAKDGHYYDYSEGQQDGMILAHLIQAHGWSREGAPRHERT